MNNQNKGEKDHPIKEEEPIKNLENVTKKIDEKEIESLQKIADLNKEPELTADEATVLDIITKRKFLDQVRREFNLARRPFSKELYDEEKILKILSSLEKKELAKKLKVPDGFVWVSVQHIRYKALGSDRL